MSKYEPITKDMLENYQSTVRIFAHYNSRYNKAIDMVTEPITKKIQFITVDHSSRIYIGSDLDKAISIYNSIKGK